MKTKFKILILILIGVPTGILWLQYAHKKSFERHQYGMCRNMALSLEMYYLNKENIFLPSHENYRKNLNLHYNKDLFIYHYKEGQKFSDVNNVKSKILTYDGWTLYGDYHIEAAIEK